MSSSRKSERKRKPSSGSAPSTDKTRSKARRRSPASPPAGASRARAQKPAAKAARKRAAARLRFDYGQERLTFAAELPLLPLRDVVIFPGMMVPLLVGRPASVAAIEVAVARNKFFAAIAQHDPQETEPEPEDLHDVGTVVRAIQILKIPDGTMKVLVEGICRFRAERVGWKRNHLAVQLALAEPAVRASSEIKALTRRCVAGFQEYVQLNRRIPDEIVAALGGVEDPRAVAHVISGHLLIDLAKRQELLGQLDLREHLETLARTLDEELEILRIERKIEGDVRTRVTRGQKEFYLQEQLKAIRRELGESGGEDDDGAELLEAIEKAGMPRDVREKAVGEVRRLSRMSPMSPEAAVVRGYVETLAALPWKKRTRDRLDLERAREILDEDHYGLDKVKDRILEYLAVVKLVKRPRGSILCLVGPPGVGKTSLGRSVARALGRKFVRVALGGVRDEAEIRGHRRTYIGSMPGRIVQGVRRAGTKNPVFLLDEVDKLSSDFRGDPASALLEVLDPEQNRVFSDHYLDCDFDLSEVLFITTANVLPAIPPPLRDRMEILRLPGYLEHEKIGIGKKFLLPKQLAEHGLTGEDLSVSNEAWKTLVTRYTREAGVRNLEREVASLCRKVARRKVRGLGKKMRIGAKKLENLLGPRRFPERRMPEKDRVGVASGLAWTEYGGDVLPVEVAVLPGNGKISLTGRLGEVMRESASTALTYARSRAAELGLSSDFAERIDLHVHMPEGAIPKDGPSAGVCITTAVISALTRVPVRRDVAMTGEITLLGDVLSIGGLNEKVVAAALAGYTHVIVPKGNEPVWQELTVEVKRGLRVTFVEHVDEVLAHALVPSAAISRLVERKDEPPGLPGIAH